jgi:hypothetical protein
MSLEGTETMVRDGSTRADSGESVLADERDVRRDAEGRVTAPRGDHRGQASRRPRRRPSGACAARRAARAQAGPHPTRTRPPRTRALETGRRPALRGHRHTRCRPVARSARTVAACRCRSSRGHVREGDASRDILAAARRRAARGPFDAAGRRRRSAGPPHCLTVPEARRRRCRQWKPRRCRRRLARSAGESSSPPSR